MFIENRKILSKYLRDIKKYELIDNSVDERDLIKRVKEGDAIAEHKLIMANTRFVIFVAKSYSHIPNIELEDLISEGNLGLIKAAKKFELDKDVKFISYAVWWIRHSITGYINNCGRVIRLPANIINGDDYESKTLPEVVSSIDMFIGDDEGETYADYVKDDESESDIIEFDKPNLNKILHEAIDTLTEREADVIRRIYGINCEENSLDILADEYDISRERVRQIKNKALLKLRNKSKDFINQFY